MVLKYAGRGKFNKRLWECKCACGNIKTLPTERLTCGHTRSCGCLRGEFLKQKGNQFGSYTREFAMWSLAYAAIRRRHKKFDGELFEIDDFINKSKLPCYYCGEKWSKILLDRKSDSISYGLISDTQIKCNGIDRIDSNMGYTKENTVPCCTKCNTAKNTMSVMEFKKWVKKVYKNFGC